MLTTGVHLVEDNPTATIKFDLSLRLRHPSADLSPIVRSLGLTPDVAWMKGDQRRTPAGNALPGTRDASYCSARLSVTDEDLETALSKCLDVIAPAGQMLATVAASGGAAVIAIGWFCDGDSGAAIPADMVARAAALQLGLDVYLYVVPETA